MRTRIRNKSLLGISKFKFLDRHLNVKLYLHNLYISTKTEDILYYEISDSELIFNIVIQMNKVGKKNKHSFVYHILTVNPMFILYVYLQLR